MGRWVDGRIGLVLSFIQIWRLSICQPVCPSAPFISCTFRLCFQSLSRRLLCLVGFLLGSECSIGLC